MNQEDAPLARARVCAQAPAELIGIRTHAVPEAAAGPTGVVVAAKHVFGQAGVVRGLRVLGQVNQFEGFDCPGCAWPDPDAHRSALGEFCENGAKAVAEEATRKRVTPAFFEQWSVAALSERSDYWLGRQGRLTQPMVLEAGAERYRPITWDAAYALVADELNGLETPDDAVFYTSGRTSNEAAFLYQLFVRQLGTNNLPDCSNLCHESSGAGLGEAIGIGKGTVTLEDFERTGLVLVVGQNPGTNHPRMLQALRRAKETGARILHVNPLPEAGLVRFRDPKTLDGWVGKGTALADQFLQVRINGDLALLKGIQKALLKIERQQPGTVVPAVFVADRTEGFADFVDDLRATPWARIVADSGVPQAEIERAAQACAETDRIIVCWAMGLTQHVNGVANVQACSNLLLMRGAIGRPGAGACPVRGHSNVQGDRTMGIWERPQPAFLDALAREFDFEPPRHHGVHAVGAIERMAQRPGCVFFALGGNFLSATPDTEFTADALRRCALTVQVSTKLNRSHLITGRRALILPCLGRTERDVQASGPQFVSVENSMGVVHQSRGGLTPASPHLRSEPAIVAQLAEATLGPRSTVAWTDLVANYDRVRDLISRVIPGFEDYNRRVRTRGGFYLPNPPREGRFPTPSGKARFCVHPLPDNVLADGELLMMTVRSHDQYNTTIYGLDDRYRGVRNERRVVFAHPDDLAAQGLSDGDLVDIVGSADGGKRVARTFVVVPFDVPRGNCATYFPEANVLVPVHHTAHRSHTPASKAVRVRLQPAQAAMPADPDGVPA